MQPFTDSMKTRVFEDFEAAQQFFCKLPSSLEPKLVTDSDEYRVVCNESFTREERSAFSRLMQARRSFIRVWMLDNRKVVVDETLDYLWSATRLCAFDSATNNLEILRREDLCENGRITHFDESLVSDYLDYIRTLSSSSLQRIQAQLTACT